MRKIPTALTLLSLAACLAACLPESSGGPGPGDGPRDTSSADTPDTSLLRRTFGEPCVKDTECERNLVCEDGRCEVVGCIEHADCGDDTDPSNQRGCHLSVDRCTAQECVIAASLNCAEHFGLPGTTCDGRVCQEN